VFAVWLLGDCVPGGDVRGGRRAVPPLRDGVKRKEPSRALSSQARRCGDRGQISWLTESWGPAGTRSERSGRIDTSTVDVVACRCMRADQLRGHVGMLLLAALASGPAHGYALSGELRRRSGGRLAIVEGSLYPALHRLEAAGLVASSTEDIDGRRRRRYELTADGKTALKDEMRSWEMFKACVDDVLREIP
jgi:PadR family transcriptional regulator, regulatory protein PadR